VRICSAQAETLGAYYRSGFFHDLPHLVIPACLESLFAAEQKKDAGQAGMTIMTILAQ